MFERYKSNARFHAGGVNTAASGALQGRAHAFDRLAGQFHDLADMEASEERKKEETVKALKDVSELGAVKERARNRVQELEQDFRNQPEEFRKQWDLSTGAILSQFPDLRHSVEAANALRDLGGQSYRRIRDNAFDRRFKSAIAAFNTEAEGRLQDAIRAAHDGDGDALSAAQSDLNAMLAEAKGAGMIDDEKAQAFERDFATRVAEEKYMSHFEAARRRGQADEFLDAFLQSPNKDMDLDMRERLTQRMFRSVERDIRLDKWANAEHDEATSRSRALRASELELGIVDGATDEEAIDQAFGQGLISGPKRTELMKQLRKAGEVREERAARAHLVRQSIESGVGMDHGDKTHIQAVEEAFQALGADPVDALILARNTGILPPSYRSVIRTHARQGNASQVLGTAETVSQMFDFAPHALEDVAEKDLALLTTVADMTRGGADPEQALEIARANAHLPEGEREQVDRQFQAEVQDVDLADKLRDEFDDAWFGSGPTPPAAMLADYRGLVSEFYRFGRDMETATTQAARALRRVWGVSEVNGDDELMRHPPEIALGVDAGTLREALTEDLAEHDLKPDQIRVVSDALTARSKRGQRTYALLKVRKNGVPVLLRGKDNMPLRWLPNPGKVLERRHVEALEEAENDRADRRRAFENVNAMDSLGAP